MTPTAGPPTGTPLGQIPWLRTAPPAPEPPPGPAPAPAAYPLRGAPGREHAGPGRASVDWALVAGLREQVARLLADDPDTAGMSRDGQQAAARRHIDRVIGDHVAAQIRAGEREELDEPAVSAAVFDALFGLGAIQPLIELPDVENVWIMGTPDNGLATRIQTAGRPAEAGPPLAGSVGELIALLQFIAGRQDPARAFSASKPVLDLSVDDGRVRLNASHPSVTDRLNVVLRVHRLRRVTLADLENLGTITAQLREFLSAAVRAGLSIVVSGEMGAGKTTLLRALCSEIPPEEALGTFETEQELYLRESGNHPVVIAWHERQGQGDPRPDGSHEGDFDMSRALFASFRQSLSRQIVGEVRGREIIPMIKAMQSGTGSLSTTHAYSAGGALDKLVTCAQEDGTTEAYAVRALGTSVDLVVHIRQETGGGRTRKVVTEVLAVGYVDGKFERTDVFGRPPGAAGPAAPRTMPEHLRARLAGHGWNPAGFNTAAGGRP